MSHDRKRPVFFLNPKSLYFLSALKLENNQPGEAIFYLERLKELDPFNSELDYQIAEIEYSQEKLDEAEKRLKKAIRENTPDLQFAPCLGYVKLS